MTLYYEKSAGVWEQWTGETLNGILHSLSIEQLWSTEELAGAGLYVPAPADPIPEGKRAVSYNVQRVNGTVKFVAQLEDVPEPHPRDYPLNDRQLRLGLVAQGFNLLTIQNTIDGIADPQQRVVAQIWWERSISIQWDHPMTQVLIGLVGLDEATATAWWLAAKDIVA